MRAARWNAGGFVRQYNMDNPNANLTVNYYGRSNFSQFTLSADDEDKLRAGLLKTLEYISQKDPTQTFVGKIGNETFTYTNGKCTSTADTSLPGPLPALHSNNTLAGVYNQQTAPSANAATLPPVILSTQAPSVSSHLSLEGGMPPPPPPSFQLQQGTTPQPPPKLQTTAAPTPQVNKNVYFIKRKDQSGFSYDEQLRVQKTVSEFRKNTNYKQDISIELYNLNYYKITGNDTPESIAATTAIAEAIAKTIATCTVYDSSNKPVCTYVNSTIVSTAKVATEPTVMTRTATQLKEAYQGLRQDHDEPNNSQAKTNNHPLRPR